MTDLPLMILAALAGIACIAVAYAAGRRRERRDLWPDACAASRYRDACRDIMVWCSMPEFRAARLVAAHIQAHGDGEVINAGTPHGDEPCTVDGMREQLRRLQSESGASGAPSDPMDWPLPCDVRVGHGVMRKGVRLGTLVARMKVLYEMATGASADEVAARTLEQRQALFEASGLADVSGQATSSAEHGRRFRAELRKPGGLMDGKPFI